MSNISKISRRSLLILLAAALLVGSASTARALARTSRHAAGTSSLQAETSSLAAETSSLAAGTSSLSTSAEASLVNPEAGCGSATSAAPTDRLRVVGTHMEDSDGHVIVPEGISIVGGPEAPNYLTTERSTDAQIEAATRAWHVNSQRLQVAETNLMSHPTAGHGYNVRFADYLNGLICRILDAHEIAIINDCTWFTGNSPSPTEMTVRFWNYMALNYRDEPVIFDLFDEPRLDKLANGEPMNEPQVWRLWKSGGRFDGVRYFGMQQLVDDIRNTDHADNVVWVESAYETSRTYALPGHLIRGTNLMYSFHKLPLVDPDKWHLVGKLEKDGVALVDGEWSSFAALHRPWECYADAYTAAPAYLKYWKSLGVGIEAWSLQYGALVRGKAGNGVGDGSFTGVPTSPGPLEIPNRMTKSYGCDSASLGQGAGQLVMRYFAANSVAAPRALFSNVK